jgi:hypothetical protein
VRGGCVRGVVDNSASDSQLLHIPLSDPPVDNIGNTHLDLPMKLRLTLVISFTVCLTGGHSLLRRKFQVANTLSLPTRPADCSCIFPDADAELPLRPVGSTWWGGEIPVDMREMPGPGSEILVPPSVGIAFAT